MLYPGDRAARDRSDPTGSRFAALFEAFHVACIDCQQDDFADEVAAH